MNPNWSPGWKAFYVVTTLALFGLVMWLLGTYLIGPFATWATESTREDFGLPGLIVLIAVVVIGPWVAHYFINVRGSRAAKQDVLPPRPGS
jgi:hypothetical protein